MFSSSINMLYRQPHNTKYPLTFLFTSAILSTSEFLTSSVTDCIVFLYSDLYDVFSFGGGSSSSSSVATEVLLVSIHSSAFCLVLSWEKCLFDTLCVGWSASSFLFSLVSVLSMTSAIQDQKHNELRHF